MSLPRQPSAEAQSLSLDSTSKLSSAICAHECIDPTNMTAVQAKTLGGLLFTNPLYRYKKHLQGAILDQIMLSHEVVPSGVIYEVIERIQQPEAWLRENGYISEQSTTDLHPICSIYSLLGALRRGVNNVAEFTKFDRYFVIETVALSPQNLTREQGEFLAKIFFLYLNELNGGETREQELYLGAGANRFNLRCDHQGNWLNLTLHLTAPILSYRAKYSHEDRYAILAPRPHAEGACSQVVASGGKLTPYKQGLELGKVNRVVHQRSDIEQKKRSIMAEARILQMLPHLHSSLPAFALVTPTMTVGGGAEREHAFILQAQMPGYELFECITNLKTDIITKLRIMREIAYAYRDQVHARGVIHRDPKPSNVMINLEGENVDANIIDFDLAITKSQSSNLNSCAGTYGYMAPEAFPNDGHPDEKTDVYSVGMMFGDVLGRDYVEFNREAVAKAFADANDFDQLFQNLFLLVAPGELSTEQESTLKNLLRAMTWKSRADRTTFDQVIAVLEPLVLIKKLERVEDQGLADAIRVAHQKALALRSDLVTKILEPNFDMNAALSAKLTEILDHPLLMQEFIETLRVRVFRNLHTKAALQEKATAVYKSAQTEFHWLSESIDKSKTYLDYLTTKSPALAELAEKVYLGLCGYADRYDAYPFTYDNQEILSAKIKAKRAVIDPLLEDLKCLVEEVKRNAQAACKSYDPRHFGSSEKPVITNHDTATTEHQFNHKYK